MCTGTTSLVSVATLSTSEVPPERNCTDNDQFLYICMNCGRIPSATISTVYVHLTTLIGGFSDN